MFGAGMNILYGTTGVCRIREIRRETFSGETKEYYILLPADDPGITIYVPTDAPALTGQMRGLLTRDELSKLIDTIPKENDMEWIADPRGRNECFQAILNTGDRRRMVQMLRVIRRQRVILTSLGKRLYVADEAALRRAEKMIYGEIAAILNIHPEEAQSYLFERFPAEG